MIRRMFVAVALLACSAGSLVRSAEPDRSQVFVGYVFGPNRGLDYKLYTHLAHAFVTADAEGKIQPNRDVPNRDLTAAAHQHHVQVLLSLGGWGWDEQFAAIATHPEAEARYVASVLKMVDDFDYDGIDFDWEYPDTAAEVVGFERITRKFRAGVDAIGQRKHRAMRITMAASSNEGTLRWLATDFLVETMDWINVMTYDYTGDWVDYAGHQSPLFGSAKQPGKEKHSTVATLEYLLNDRKVPPDRLALGIPLYGRGFPVSQPYASTKGVAKKRIPGGDYREIAKLMQAGWTRTWDDETKTPWLLAYDHSAVIGYDDAESVALKTAWAMQHNLRGVFFWQVLGDQMPDGKHPLQEASHRAWEAGKRP